MTERADFPHSATASRCSIPESKIISHEITHQIVFLPSHRNSVLSELIPRCQDITIFNSLNPFAPSQLRDFIATMGQLTSCITLTENFGIVLYLYLLIS